MQPFESLINRGIDRSTTAQAMALALEGRSLELRVEGTPVSLRLEAAGGRVRIGPTAETAADVALSGPPLAIARLLGGNAQALIRDGDVRITGSAELAGQFQELLGMARPDIEEELSKLVGDAAAGELGNLARNVAGWGGRARDSLARSVGEYLQEERRVLVTRSEVREFCAEVDDVTNGVERAEARVARLQVAAPAAPTDKPR